MRFASFLAALVLALSNVRPASAASAAPDFTLVQALFKKHCVECHDADTKKGNLDLTALKLDFADAENFARWVKVHDRVRDGESGIVVRAVLSPDLL